MYLKLPNYSPKFIDAYINFMISRYIDNLNDKELPLLHLNKYNEELKDVFSSNCKTLKKNLIKEHYLQEDYFNEIFDSAIIPEERLKKLVKKKFGISNKHLMKKIRQSNFVRYKDENWYEEFVEDIDNLVKTRSEAIKNLVQEIEEEQFDNFYEYFRKLILIKPEKIEKYVSNIRAQNYKADFSDIKKLYNLSKEIEIDGKSRKINTFMINNFINNGTGLTVCPYCNRSYINSRERNLGAELDHFYNKKDYPMFAISLYNFIPSCSTCNRLKGTHGLKINPFLNNENKIKFDIIADLKGYVIEIKRFSNGELSDISSCGNLKNDIIDVLKIDKAYEVHNHEVRKMVKREEEYSTDYRKFLRGMFSGDDKEIENKVDELIYGDIVFKSEDELINHSLGKFKKDVYEKIKEWKKRGNFREKK